MPDSSKFRLGERIFIVITIVSTMPFSWNYGTLAVGVVLLATGLWQLTPFKNAYLKRCVSPLGFFLTHSSKGFGGAIRMGAEHGYYCYMYMLVVFVVVGMSLPAMVLLAIMITLEKALLKGARWFNWLISIVFIILDLIVRFFRVA